jgi:sec-independent protein translocase protein TatC
MESNKEAPLLGFLIELRKRLMFCLLTLTIVFFSLFYFANQLYTCLALPLLKYLPQGHGLIAINIAAPFFAPMELTLFLALCVSIPVFLYQLWKFIAPALYKHEKKFVWPLLCVSTLLFYSGVAFAYFVVLPLLFSFITHTVPSGVNVSPDMTEYLDFTLKLFTVFGVTFEIPIVTLLLIYSGIVSRKQLVKARPYVIVGAFVVGMLLGPPDVLSQTLLALPIWLLFEAGLLLSRFWGKRMVL